MKNQETDIKVEEVKADLDNGKSVTLSVGTRPAKGIPPVVEKIRKAEAAK